MRIWIPFPDLSCSFWLLRVPNFPRIIMRFSLIVMNFKWNWRSNKRSVMLIKK
nr:MAG TPA: hypothetical protein [Bacteriophage sp.]